MCALSGHNFGQQHLNQKKTSAILGQTKCSFCNHNLIQKVKVLSSILGESILGSRTMYMFVPMDSTDFELRWVNLEAPHNDSCLFHNVLSRLITLSKSFHHKFYKLRNFQLFYWRKYMRICVCEIRLKVLLMDSCNFPKTFNLETHYFKFPAVNLIINIDYSKNGNIKSWECLCRPKQE